MGICPLSYARTASEFQFTSLGYLAWKLLRSKLIPAIIVWLSGRVSPGTGPHALSSSEQEIANAGTRNFLRFAARAEKRDKELVLSLPESEPFAENALETLSFILR